MRESLPPRQHRRDMDTHRPLLLPFFTLSLLCLSRGATAQPVPPGREAAEERFSQARRLIKAGKIAEACERFEESQALEPAIGTLLHLADCYEKRGSLPLAWMTFQEAARVARAADKLDREKKALSRASALTSRVSLLALDVNAVLPGMILRLDGHLIDRSRWNSSLAVAPGRHVVEAEAPGYLGWSATFDLAPSLSAFRVLVPALAPEPPPAVSAPSPEPPPVASSALASSPDSSISAAPPAPAVAPASGQRTLAVVAAGVGAVSLGMGAFFGWRSFSKWDARDGHCSGSGQCDETGLQRASEARSAARLSNLFFGLGTLGVGAGTILWLTAPEASASLSVTPSSGGLSLDLRRSF